ncbi:uncharacterized protein LOC123534632 isoform X2 [Mercenaria mercenaria]|uniref:uncharacterized protein LOC123534632 isoform X2 n=1 Tax=Mercenaria mercenaria TaxID=6596 RepID=UPI00234E7ECC|nr:uncharacterized protein LOC123534632 isoform X2 [Mercenaria mercenaria]XP_053375833.1 uncharacterized protein LOC123534632 isoform X2 [Mercenaria mercenaria]
MYEVGAPICFTTDWIRSWENRNQNDESQRLIHYINSKMADGRLSTSIKDGSDADFDYICTPCEEDHIREEAVKYCPECEEYLCTKCTNQHGRRKATLSHKLLDKDATKRGSMVTIATKCRYHPNRDIEMYCGAHDMVYCLKCIAKEHRSCNDVSEIEDVHTSFVHQKEVQRLQDQTRNIQERLIAIDRKTQKNIDSLEEQRDDVLAKIEEIEKNLIEHIRKLKYEAISTLNKDYTSEKEELKHSINIMTNTKKEIENASSQLQTFTSMEAGQQFVQMKLIQQTVKDAVKLVEEREATGSKTLCFTENTDLKTSIMAATPLGHVNTVTENERQTAQRICKVKSKGINIKMQNDRKRCYIIDVCQLQDGTIMLADCDNKKIKRLDMNYNIKDHCDPGSYPMGICCTGQNEVAVKMYNNKVQFISVGSSLSKLSEITVEGGGFWGMAFCAGELWIPSGMSVNVYSTSGTLLKTISKDIKTICKSTIRHMAGSGETVIVTDNSDGAVCLGRNYTVQRELRDKRLVNTLGVCVSSDGTVFLSGFSSQNIVMFDKTGKNLGELVPKDAGLENQAALHYDDKRNCLIVTCANSDKVIIFDISD